MDKESMLFYYSITLCIVIVLVFLFMRTAQTSPLSESQHKAYIENLGWHVIGDCIETQQINIPTEFDEVYENYNSLQQQAGFDLKPYRGQNAVRYTYIITNYPVSTTHQVRVNLIEHKGKIIGGDIMTTALDGFMHPLLINNKNH